MLNVACMQKIKIGHRAKFRDKDKCFLQLLFPVRAILRCISTSVVVRTRLLIEISVTNFAHAYILRPVHTTRFQLRFGVRFFRRSHGDDKSHGVNNRRFDCNLTCNGPTTTRNNKCRACVVDSGCFNFVLMLVT